MAEQSSKAEVRGVRATCTIYRPAASIIDTIYSSFGTREMTFTKEVVGRVATLDVRIEGEKPGDPVVVYSYRATQMPERKRVSLLQVTFSEEYPTSVPITTRAISKPRLSAEAARQALYWRKALS
jgi:hypothetical protein